MGRKTSSFNPIVIAYHEHAAIIRDIWSSSDWKEGLRAIFASPASLAERPIKYRSTQIEAGERDPA